MDADPTSNQAFGTMMKLGLYQLAISQLSKFPQFAVLEVTTAGILYTKCIIIIEFQACDFLHA